MTVCGDHTRPVWRPEHQLDDVEMAVLEFVHAYRLAHDTGPLWSEVAVALDWPGWEQPKPVGVSWREHRRRRQHSSGRLWFLIRGRWLKGARRERGLALGWRGRAALGVAK